MENIVQNIIENLTNYDTNFLSSSSSKNKEKPKDNMSIKTEEGKVNFVFDEDDEEDSASNDIDNILSFEQEFNYENDYNQFMINLNNNNIMNNKINLNNNTLQNEISEESDDPFEKFINHTTISFQL